MHTRLSMKIGMAFLTLLLNSGLLFVGVTTQEIDSSSITDDSYFRLPNHIIPQHYDIELELYMYIQEEVNNTVSDIHGKMVVNISVVQKTYSISLHAEKPYVLILKSMLVKEHMDIQTSVQAVKYGYCNISNTRTFYFNTEILPGNYNLIIHFYTIYDANDKANSWFKTLYRDTKGMTTFVAGTHFLGIGARKIFPCWDEPGIRATFNISIKHHKEHTVLSNMPKLMTVLDKDGEKAWSRFSTTPAIPTYLIAITINIEPNFLLKIDNKVGNIWRRRIVSYISDFAETFAAQVAEYFHEKFEIVKMNPQSLDIVVIPVLPDNGIANWGLILYRETDIVYEKGLDSAMQKIRVASLVAREMAHHWYGNYISPFWWNNFWLNDGIAMLLGMHAIDKIYPKFRILDLFVVQILHESLHLDSFAMQPLYYKLNIESPTEINSLFSFPRYIKASSILRMLQHVLTDDVFWHGVKSHLKAYMFDKANSNNFWHIMQDAKHSSSLGKRFNIRRVMNTWRDKTYYPVLNVKRNYIDFGDLLISIDNLDTQKQDKWWIPVTITTQTECNFTQSFHHYGTWLKTTRWNVPYCEIRLPYEESGWIIVNLQQTGYYRVNYDRKNWMSIASYLLVENYTNIHVLNRAQIIDDAFHLMLDHKLDSSIFWNLTAYLHRETDYVAWYPMFKALEHMSRIFLLQVNKVTEIKVKLQSLLTALLENIGYNERANENDLTKFLRQEAVKWACTLDATECIYEAKEKLAQHLTNPEKHKLLPWWKHWTYCKGLIATNITTWSKLIRKYVKKRDPDIVKAVAYYDEFNIIQIFLQIMSKENGVIPNTEHRVHGFFHIVAKNAKRNIVLDYLLKEFTELKPTEVSLAAALVHIINHVYTKEQIWKIHTFAKKTIDDRYVYLAVRHKIRSRWFEITRQLIYLMNF
ncbi:glutamyl aminopeptidase-like [Temnothorax curvispinosus]|uniref:Aminopeptidase n=2 Tax=Temnothorax TaxID=300110 RepID=A0A6J1PIR2_9HYME|nr:glutamyl aminopeptidase-like [Temnothorax curvispinosus]